jgi:hypothetical protein
MCSGDEAEQRWHAAATYGIFFSKLVVSTLPSVSIERLAVTASADYRLSPESTLGAGIGAGLGGVIGVETKLGAIPTRFLVLPGWELTFSYSRRLLDGRGKAPFLVLGVSGGASGAWTRQEVLAGPAPATSFLYAFDVRGGLIVGKTLWNTLSPYAVFRAFGGPLVWSYRGQTVVGGDLYHVQLGAGLVTVLPREFDVFVEGVPLGEAAVTLGVGKTF